MNRSPNILVFSIAAAVVAGAVGYGWQQLVKPPPMPPVPPLRESAALLGPIPEPAAAPQPPPPLMRLRVRFQPDPAIAQQAAEDRQVFEDLRHNCYDAAAYNSSGQYPALQAAACDRYAQFAGERGWYTGALPGYAQPPPPQPVVEQQPYTAWDQGAWDQGGSPQLVYVGPVYDLGLAHQRPPRQPQHNEPQGQIGPNYTPPPMQQAPPVSQQHSPMRSAPSARMR